MFWILAPFLVAFILGMPLLVARYTVGSALVMALLCTLAFLLLLGLFDVARFAWALRVAAALLFTLYAAYAVHQWGFTDTPFQLFERRSNASPRNSLLGVFFIGLPALHYAWRGGRSAGDDDASPDDF